MTKKELEQYLLQSLNMVLGTSMQGETSYTNSFDCQVMEEGFHFLPRLPADYITFDWTSFRQSQQLQKLLQQLEITKTTFHGLRDTHALFCFQKMSVLMTFLEGLVTIQF